MYADDVILIATNLNMLQRLLNICSKYSKAWYIKFNPHKFCIFHTGLKLYTNDQINVSLDGIRLNVVDEMLYLGLKINSKFDYNTYIIEKFKKVKQDYYSLYNFEKRPNGLQYAL